MAEQIENHVSATMINQANNWSVLSHKDAIVALIPAFNEERFIGSLVLAVQEYVDHVIVVDDGSSDQTTEIARRAGAIVLRHEVNQGKAAGVNTGFNYLRQLQPAAVVMLDGDGQHSADDIPTVLEPITSGEADIVIGSRFLEVKSEIPAYRQVGQHGLTMITNVASGTHSSDSQSGYRAFSRRAIDALIFGNGGFSIESEMQFLANEHHLNVVEVPIKVTYAEPAKRNPFAHGMQVVNAVLRLVGQTRPLLYFGMPGIITLVSGVLLGLRVLQIYSAAKQLAQGYALLSVGLCVTGMLLLFSALILHSVRGMMVDLRQRLFERLSDPYRRKVVYEDEALLAAYAAADATDEPLKEREYGL